MKHQRYDWWIIEDEYGKDACVRFKETSLLMFSRTMLSKRMEDSEEIDVNELYADLIVHLEAIRKEAMQMDKWHTRR